MAKVKGNMFTWDGRIAIIGHRFRQKPQAVSWAECEGKEFLWKKKEENNYLDRWKELLFVLTNWVYSLAVHAANQFYLQKECSISAALVRRISASMSVLQTVVCETRLFGPVQRLPYSV